MVSCKSNDEFIFKCLFTQIKTSPNKLIYAFRHIPKTEIENVSKELMYRGRCPFTMGSGSLCPANCKYHLYDYIEKCEYILSEEENCSYMNVYANETGKSKLSKVEEEIIAGEQNYFLNIFVDGNLRCNDAVFDEEKIIIEGG